jgi:hypothetical protein
LVAQELILSFVPDIEQRLWRTVMRRKYQITRNRVQLHNRPESLLEEGHINISSVVSNLLGTSARRMLHAVGDGETDPTALAALADSRLRATPDQLRDAFGACADLHPVYRRLVKLTLDELRLIEDQLAQLDQQMADLLTAHHDAVHSATASSFSQFHRPARHDRERFSTLVRPERCLDRSRGRVCSRSGAFAVDRFCVPVRAPAVRINAPHTTSIASRWEAMPAIMRQLREAR